MSDPAPDFLRPVNRSFDAVVDEMVGVSCTQMDKGLKVVARKMSGDEANQTLMVKLFTRGLAMTDIAETLKVSYEDVSDFLTGHVGAAMVRQFVDSDDETAVRDILSAARIDTIMGLLKQRDFGENGTVRINAGKELTAMLVALGPKKGLKGMTPEQAFAEAKKRMDKLTNKQTNE
jgi:hypothetical protein